MRQLNEFCAATSSAIAGTDHPTRLATCVPKTGAATRRARSRRSVVAAALAVASLALSACGGGTKLASSSQSSTTTAVESAANSATALINTGIAQANAKQYGQAETTFRDVLVISPNNKFAWYNLGLIAQVQNQSSPAVADYSKAVSIDPKYTPAMYNKAILLERTNLHSALALYQQITSINPKAATAYLRESFVYDRLHDQSKAKQARARALALDPSLSTVTSPGQ
ncbi:MAG TPA: tetratricopeptide repeat protein [Solirubrobacteraceae bacterium]|nr:tetratricopeptide repeat protein [Solirubrobacteraceae bacterium]